MDSSIKPITNMKTMGVARSTRAESPACVRTYKSASAAEGNIAKIVNTAKNQASQVRQFLRQAIKL